MDDVWGGGLCVREKDNKQDGKWQNTLKIKRRLLLFHPRSWMWSLQQTKEAKCSTILSKFSFYACTITNPFVNLENYLNLYEKKSAHLESGLQTWIKYYHVKEPFSSTDRTNYFRSENTCLSHKPLHSFSNRSHLGANW